jgi:hypothetical protein
LPLRTLEQIHRHGLTYQAATSNTRARDSGLGQCASLEVIVSAGDGLADFGPEFADA